VKQLFAGHRHPGARPAQHHDLRPATVHSDRLRRGGPAGILGIVVGLLAGYLGGKIDAVLMRIADIQLSFPYLMVAIFISAIFQLAFGIGRYEDLAVPLLIVIIGLAEWPVYARTVRASVMGEKSKEYVEAARVIGLNRWRIMFRHVLPNTMTSVLVISTIQVANAIMSEAALSFLGWACR
jgi:peptide/nickel transport system permease protein